MSTADLMEKRGKNPPFPGIPQYNNAYEITEHCNYADYLKAVIRDYQRVNDFFPDLKLCIMPTVKPHEAFIYGWLIPRELCQLMTSEKDKKRYGIYIKAIYPFNYHVDREDIAVEDFNNVIDWSRIPYEHRHRLIFRDRKAICTHHPDGEINKVPKEDRSVKILASAWKLYNQYQEYLKTGIWTLPDRKHGDDAINELVREGYYKKKTSNVRRKHA